MSHCIGDQLGNMEYREIENTEKIKRGKKQKLNSN